MRQARDHARSNAGRAAAWHRELFDLVQSRREFLLLVPLKLTLKMMRGNNGIVNKMEF
jgi:hypothetical protein